MLWEQIVAAHPTNTEFKKAEVRVRREQCKEESMAKKQQQKVGNASKVAVKANVEKMDVKESTVKKQQKKAGNASKVAVKASVETMDVKSGMGGKRIMSGTQLGHPPSKLSPCLRLLVMHVSRHGQRLCP
jgi:hypothetical protein